MWRRPQEHYSEKKYCSVGNCKSILQENEQYDAVPDTARENNSEQSPNVLTIAITGAT